MIYRNVVNKNEDLKLYFKIKKWVKFSEKEKRKRNFCLDLSYIFIFDMVILFMVIYFISKCIFVSMVMIN